MKYKKLAFCCLLVLALLCVTACKQGQSVEATEETFVSGEYKYRVLKDGTAEITEYIGGMLDLVIPSELDGKKVTSLGAEAFKSGIWLYSITLPDSLTHIAGNPFANVFGEGEIRVSQDHPALAVIDGVLFSKADKRLIYYSHTLENTTYTVPQGTKRIEDSAFSNCNSLKSITLPDSLTHIAGNPFLDCETLERIEVSQNHPALAVIDGVLFSKTDKRLICYPMGLMYTEYVIPQDIVCIGDFAFSGCSLLTSITLPDNLTSIGNSAFEDCDSLTSITLPNSVACIGNSAFEDCDSLTSITLPNSLTSIGNSAFEDCTSLTCITLPDSLTHIAGNPFTGCEVLERIDVSKNHPALASIDGVLFSKADKRLICYPMGLMHTEYTVPQGTVSIGDYAFYGCTSLTNIMLPDSLTSIGECAFCWCLSLSSIKLPDSLTSISKNPFAGCQELVHIEVSQDHQALAVFDDVLFGKADKRLICYPMGLMYTAYTVPHGIESIGDSAFFMCDSLESITLPDGLTYIGDNAFAECSMLTHITLSDSLTSIGDYAFGGCRSLTNIMLPESLTSIGNLTFYMCSSLRSITLPDSLTSIGDMAFMDCNSKLILNVPHGSYAEQFAKEYDLKFVYADANN